MVYLPQVHTSFCVNMFVEEFHLCDARPVLMLEIADQLEEDSLVFFFMHKFAENDVSAR